MARHTTCAVICCRRGLRPTCLTRNELSGMQPSRTLRSNIRNIRRTSEGTLLAYLWLWTAGLRKDSRKTAKCCSRFAEPCPRSQGFVSRKDWNYAPGPSWKNSRGHNPARRKTSTLDKDVAGPSSASWSVSTRGWPRPSRHGGDRTTKVRGAPPRPVRWGTLFPRNGGEKKRLRTHKAG